MLTPFTTKAYADITLLGDVGKAHRALPLINLRAAAAKAWSDAMWK